MDLSNFSGIILSLVVFVTIGFGHVMVRKVNYITGTKLAPLMYLIGAGMIVWSLFVSNDILSASIGITAMTVLFDGYELHRQEERIRNGSAPENPNRPVEKK